MAAKHVDVPIHLNSPLELLYKTQYVFEVDRSVIIDIGQFILQLCSCAHSLQLISAYHTNLLNLLTSMCSLELTIPFQEKTRHLVPTPQMLAEWSGWARIWEV